MKRVRAQYERPLPLKVLGSLVFGFLGFCLIQTQIIGPLTHHVSIWYAYAIAYVVSGQVVFLFDYFVARFELTTGHLGNVDWSEFASSWRKHSIVSVIGAGINATYLIHWHLSDSNFFNVFIANGVSAVVTQTIKWMYIHRPGQHHEVRRVE